jgi:uncharacterized protein DUF3667
VKTGLQRETWSTDSDRVTAELEHLCLNCGEPLHGAFCSACGQRVVPPRPSLRELLGEAFAEFSGWDGKLANTLRLLITRPGQLTLDFLDGRRVRCISPLRLYLSVSVVYFLLSAAAPVGVASGKFAQATNASTATHTTNINLGAGANMGDELSPEDREQILAAAANAPRLLRPAMRRLASDPAGFRKDFSEVSPKLFFALLPVFAVILALFYRGRGFIEHLYFTIHVQTFFFITLGLGVLARFTHVFALTAAAATVAFIWTPLYAHFALRRVYGGSNGANVLKEIGIGVLYAAVYIPSVVSLAVWVGNK